MRTSEGCSFSLLLFFCVRLCLLSVCTTWVATGHSGTQMGHQREGDILALRLTTGPVCVCVCLHSWLGSWCVCVCLCVALGCSGSISLCISKKLVSRRSERSQLAPCCKLPCDFDSCTFISDHLYHLSDVNCVRLRPAWGNYGPWARYGPPPLVQGLVKMMSMVTDNKCAKFSMSFIYL